MKEKLKYHLWAVIFTLVYIIGFTAVFISRGDYEFLWYVLVLVLLAGLVGITINRSDFDRIIIWGLSLWGFLHMAGGGIKVDGGILYTLVLLPIFDAGNELMILKYDQAVHFFGFGVATLVVYHLLRPYLSAQTKMAVIIVITVVAGTGLGVLNEIVEFIAVLAIPDTNVGGYYNTALDLVFNTLGAVAAAFYIAYYREPKIYSHKYGAFKKN